MHAFRTLGVIAGLLAAFANTANAAAAASAAPAAPCPKSTTVALDVQRAVLCVPIDDPAMSLRRPVLAEWIARSGRILADYYRHFPAPLVLLRVQAAPGVGVHGGRTTHDAALV